MATDPLRGPLRLRGEGTATLDDTLRPIAALQTRVAGFTETLDALASQGIIAKEAARLAGIALRLLARTPEGGGRPELTVPISVQEGDFYLGPVRMGQYRRFCRRMRSSIAPRRRCASTRNLGATRRLKVRQRVRFP